MQRSRHIEFLFGESDASEGAQWRIEEPHHTVIVHLSGNLSSLRTEFSSGLGGDRIPQEGDVWVIPAEQHYRGTAEGAAVQYCEIMIPTAAIGRGCLAAGFGIQDRFLHQSVRTLASVNEDDSVLADMFRQSLTETMRSYLTMKYSGFSDRKEKVSVLSGEECNFFRSAIASRPDAPLGLKEMADHTGMTVHEFLVAFRLAFGTTPHQYILDWKISEAKRLLCKTSMQLTRIASHVGFTTPSQFSTTFKKRVGMTPSAYRSHLR